MTTHDPRPLLLGALACLIGLATAGVVALVWPVGLAGDSATLQGFVALDRPRSDGVFWSVSHLADPAPYALAGLALVAIALARGRPRVAVAIPAILLFSELTTQSLKHLLAHQRYDEWLGYGQQIAAASWPSGHATAAMALTLCAILAAPTRLRPTVAAVGGAFTLAVCTAILALGWHFPSDVLGGVCSAMLWTLLALAALAAAERRWPSRPRPPVQLRRIDVLGPVAVAGAAGALAAASALRRPDAAANFARDHTTALAGGAGLIAVVLMCAAALAAVAHASRT